MVIYGHESQTTVTLFSLQNQFLKLIHQTIEKLNRFINRLRRAHIHTRFFQDINYNKDHI